LYGYKMHDYHERDAILKDIEACDLPRRCTTGYSFPELRPRVEALAPLRWVTFEEVLSAAGLGDGLDVVRRPNELVHVQAAIVSKLAARLLTLPAV
jgi:hypothetical protein